MPLGAARIALFSNPQILAQAEVIRAKVGVSAEGNAQVSTAQSQFGGASALFDGSNSILEIKENNSNFIFSTDDFTIEMYFYIFSISSSQTLFDIRPKGTNQFQYTSPTIYMSSDGKLRFYNGGDNIIFSQLTSNTWTHAAAVRESGTTSLFFNGSLITSFSDTSDYLSSGLLAIGYNQTGLAGYFGGYIDEVRISNTARYTTNFTPATEPFVNDENTLLLLHMDGTPGSQFFEDDNGARKKQSIYAEGAAQISTADSQFGGASFVGDRSNKGWLDCQAPIVPESTPFTLECWFNADVVDNNSWIITQYDDAPTNGRNIISLNNEKIRYFFDDGNIESTGSVSQNTWHHVAVVRDENNEFRIYLDGVQGQSQTSTQLLYQGRNTYIGKGVGGSNDRYFDGHIDEVRISNTVRYTANFTPSTAPFVNDANTLLLLHMDGTNGSTDFPDDNGASRVTSTDILGIDYTSTGGTGYRSGQITNNATSNEYATISFWIKDSSQRIFELSQGAGGTDDIIIDHLSSQTSGGLRFTERNLGGMNRISSSVNVNDGDWHHCFLRFNTDNADDCEFYIDGVKDTGAVIDARAAGEVLNWADIDEINLGTDGETSGNGKVAQFYLDNSLQPVALFWDFENNRAYDLGTDGTATGARKPLIYHYGNTETFGDTNGDTSRYNYTMTEFGTVQDSGPITVSKRLGRSRVAVTAVGDAQVSTAESQFGGASAVFDGNSANFIKINDWQTDTSADFTVEGWVYFNNVSQTWHMLLGGEQGGGNNFYLGIKNNGDGTYGHQLAISNGSSVLYRNRKLPTNPTSNTWYHWAVCKQGTNIQQFWNGIEATAPSDGAGTMTADKGINRLYYVGRFINDLPTDGYIDEVRISNTVRYTANFTPPTEPFQNDDNTLLLLHMDGTDGSQTFVDDNGVPPNWDYGA